MREIKFRAWREATKTMFYDVYFDNLEVWCWDHENNEVRLLGDVNPGGILNTVNLMQFTGMKDCNGVKIYEGDTIEANIIEFSLPTIGHIVFSKEHSAYANRNLAGDTFLWKLDRIKVTGNIYEGEK